MTLAWDVIEGRADLDRLKALRDGDATVAVPAREIRNLSAQQVANNVQAPRQAVPRATASSPPQSSGRAKETSGENREYKAGEILFDQGDSADHLVIILSGSVEIFDPSDKHSIAILEKGFSFGEQAILEGGVRGASARAHSNATCLEIPTGPLRSILRADPGIMTPTIEALLLQLNMANTMSKKLPPDAAGLSFQVMPTNEMTSLQAKQMLREHYSNAGASALTAEMIMFLKLQIYSDFNSTVHEQGHLLMKAGDRGFTSALIVVDGTVEAVSRQGTYQLGCGSLFGLAEAMSDSALEWSLSAKTRVTLINMPIDKVQRGMTYANPAFKRIVAYTAGRICELRKSF